MKKTWTNRATRIGLTALVALPLLSLNVLAESSSSSASTSASVSTSAVDTTPQKIEDITLTVEEVIKLYKETYPNTDITSIDLDDQDELDPKTKHYVYQVEGVDDQKEYKLTIDTVTKKVIEQKEEALDNDEKDGVKRQKDKLNLDKLKDLKEILKTAEAEAKMGKVVDWELDREDNVTYWEVTFRDGTTQKEVKVDAQTNEVVEIDTDHSDDDDRD